MSSSESDNDRARGLAWKLARYVVELPFERIPDEVIAKTRAVLLHNIAISFGGVATEQGRIAVEFIEPRADGVTVIGHQVRASPQDAALANSVMIRALHMEDCLVPSYTHPGATLIPAALAVGEREGASGAEVLTALVAGYDVLGRLAGSIRTQVSIKRNNHHVFGPIATAAVAARLMRLDVEQTAAALAHASNLAVMTYTGFQNFQYGLVTRTAILAAELGRVRAPYPPDALEGPYGFYEIQVRGERPSDDDIFGELGSRFDIMTAVLKPHVCSGANLVALELLRRALREHGLTGQDIRRIRTTRSNVVRDFVHMHHKGPFDPALGGPVSGAFGGGSFVATSSLPFSMANVMLGEEITMATFENPDRPQLVPVMAKLDFEFRPFTEMVWTEMQIETNDGRSFAYKGGGEQLTTPDAAAILGTHATAVIGCAKIERLQAAVAGLETAPDLSAIASCLA